MSFPETRHTLIQRLATGGQDADWQEFMDDYWGPVCRFAKWKGSLSHEDAEDVASLTFEAILKSRLLQRWSEVPFSRLRTLLCSVVRNVLSNRARISVAREKVLREHGGLLDRYIDLSGTEAIDAPDDQLEAFYAAWVDDVLHTVVEGLLVEYNHLGKGDYFRVLYGRLCEEMTLPEIAEALLIKLTSAENYLRHMRQQLADRMQRIVRTSVLRYAPAERVEAEFASEWSLLGDFLQRHSGIEEVVRRLYLDTEPGSPAFRRPKQTPQV
jgi:RNA polymerase sigma factor (sigma-70 family)